MPLQGTRCYVGREGGPIWTTNPTRGMPDQNYRLVERFDGFYAGFNSVNLFSQPNC